ncbi:hypothetical protein TSMEX_009270 [Taenia solium]|eukprot:TsM_000690800 transcript=TsM_000690800 gene=TsM_000690800
MRWQIGSTHLARVGSWEFLATGDVYAEEKAALPSEGELELGLTLEKVTTEQDGQKLICEASTSYPPNQVAQRQLTEISVNCTCKFGYYSVILCAELRDPY